MKDFNTYFNDQGKGQDMNNAEDLVKQMAEDGYPFYLSVNGVWLTKEGKGQTTRLSLNPFLVHT